MFSNSKYTQPNSDNSECNEILQKHKTPRTKRWGLTRITKHLLFDNLVFFLIEYPEYNRENK